jgi:hypothetical protein
MNFLIRFRFYGIIIMLLFGLFAWNKPAQAADPDPEPSDPARSSSTFIPLISSPSAQPAPTVEPAPPAPPTQPAPAPIPSCTKTAYWIVRGLTQTQGPQQDKPGKL